MSKKPNKEFQIRDLAHLGEIVREVVRTQIERDSEIAKRDRKIQDVRDRYDPTITALDNEIQTGLTLIEEWSLVNPEPFGKDRSMVVDGHRIGWRTGTHKCSLIKSAKTTWKKVLSILEKSKWGEVYLSRKTTIDKDIIIRNRADADQMKKFKAIGVEVIQDETFFLDPDRADGERVKKEAQ